MARGRKVLKARAQAKKFSFKYEGVEPVQGAKGKYYPAEDVVLQKGPTPVRNPPRLRSNITPGTVLILLAGRFRGKRVVFLKALTSGLLLVSGPFGLNGVPLRRVNQKYTISTSTKVDLKGVNVAAIDDAFFAREKAAKKELFDAAAPKVFAAGRKEAQVAVDAALTANIGKVQMLGDYLKARFTLSNSDKPHLLKF